MPSGPQYSNEQWSEILLSHFRDGELTRLVEALPESYQFKIPASMPYGGLYEGPKAYEKLVTSMTGGVWDSFEMHADRVFDAGDHLFVANRVTAIAKNGRKMVAENMWLFRIEDARIVYGQLYPDSAAGLAALNG